ncbi:hypothetical protein D9757_010134 [Collybiopsis confluens]|uniref:SMP-30/Gluconolactonase/LRE-like region domain-containing protein n=1 Tax=Collybiopsis confluens TaxID=2823264 RepID=A0A8H5LUI1_9AGAR|nr:hypothetical protein D9757_010134 [Collybiopsis confluens]
MRVSLSLITILSSVAVAFCAYLPHKRATLAAAVVHTFDTGTVMENLAIRATGEILATVISSPDLWQVDPAAATGATLIHTFDGFECVFGIIELQSDQFYVLVGNADIENLTPVPGSFVAFRVDMSSFNTAGTTTITQIASFPDSQLLNGMGILDAGQGLVYVADSFAGTISVLDVNTGVSFVAINNSLTVPGAPMTTPLGVNGVHTTQDASGQFYLYFSNTAQSILARVPIHSDGTPAGDPEVIASGIIADDFTFDSDGNIMQAVIGSSEIVKINPTTKTVTTISGSPDSTELRSVSAAQFGRLSGDETTLYVTLNGGNLGDGGAVVPGAVKMIPLGS